jgi:hypothetical protein
MPWIKAFRPTVNNVRDRNPHDGRRTDEKRRGNEDKRQITRAEICEVSDSMRSVEREGRDVEALAHHPHMSPAHLSHVLPLSGGYLFSHWSSPQHRHSNSSSSFFPSSFELRSFHFTLTANACLTVPSPMRVQSVLTASAPAPCAPHTADLLNFLVVSFVCATTLWRRDAGGW